MLLCDTQKVGIDYAQAIKTVLITKWFRLHWIWKKAGFTLQTWKH